MNFLKLFFIFIYSTVFLILKDVWGGFIGNKDKTEDSKSSSASNSQGSSSDSSQSSKAQGTNLSQASVPKIPENPLDFNDLKDDYGIIKTVDLDGFKFTFFRAFVGKSFNKFKMGDLNLWPKDVTKESIHEFHMISKDEKHLLTLTSMKKEGYLNQTFLFIKPDPDNSNNIKVDNLDRPNILEKFNQFVGSKFTTPWPDGLVKDALFQDWYAFKNKKQDNTIPDDLDVI